LGVNDEREQPTAKYWWVGGQWKVGIDNQSRDCIGPIPRFNVKTFVLCTVDSNGGRVRKALSV
jgi:hypothetical protein